VQNNGQWYQYRVIKKNRNVKVFADDALQWEYSGSVPSGQFLHFGTGQAGSTAEIDDLKIYEVPPALSIEVAAVRLRGTQSQTGTT
jgi:hypothetical protein